MTQRMRQLQSWRSQITANLLFHNVCRCNPTAISLKAGCELYLRYTTRTSAIENEDFATAKARIIEVGLVPPSLLCAPAAAATSACLCELILTLSSSAFVQHVRHVGGHYSHSLLACVKSQMQHLLLSKPLDRL